MATNNLSGKRVAILATDGVEEVELVEPRRALDQAGARTSVVSPRDRSIKAWQHDGWGSDIPVDVPLANARAEDYDALFLPGGLANPDRLRQDKQAVQFVKQFAQSGRPIAAICHAPWLLIEAGLVSGRTLTSWPSLQTDIRNAGGTWVDRDVVSDSGLVTSRRPEDIPAFNRAVIDELAGGVRVGQHATAHGADTQPQTDLRA